MGDVVGARFRVREVQRVRTTFCGSQGAVAENAENWIKDYVVSGYA